MIALSVPATELLAKAAMSAAAVGVLLSLLRQAGPRASSLAAAVPVNSLPALFWLCIDHGGRYASFAALGSLAGTALTLLFGSLALVLGQRHGAPTTFAFFHGVTLGATGKQRGDRHPKVRRGALLGAGAKVLGNVEIGRCSRVAAVLPEVPPHCTSPAFRRK